MRHHSFRVTRVFCTVVVLAAIPWVSASSLLADSFDWRSVNGQNWNSTVKSQFGGTCWDFSACGTLEAKYKLTRNDYSYNPDVSEQQINWETNPNLGGTGGGWGYKVLDYFTSHGVVSDTECPYQSSSPDSGISPYWPLKSGWDSRVWKSVSNVDRFTKDADTMKAYLKTQGPLEVGVKADNDLFVSVADLKANYRGPISSLDHEVSLVGYYDDADVPSGGYWVVKNSWGSSSGDHGYYYIPYGDIENHNDVSAITGPVYYTGAMASATWKGGEGVWSSINWTKTAVNGTAVTPVDYAWENKETSALFNAPGKAITLSGTVITHGVTIASAATGYSFSGGALTVTAGGITANENATFTSPISIGAPQTWTVIGGKNLTLGDLNTIISPLTIQATGSVTITGSLDGGGVLNTAGGAAPGSITKAGAGTLYLTGAATYAVPIVLSGGTLNFAQPSGVTANFNDAISGSGTVTKSDAGLLKLNGVNTYAGFTNVTAGTLMVDGALSPTGGLLTVYSGGTVGGAGSLGQTRVYAGGHVAPGDGGVGQLSLLGTMLLYSGAKLDFDLDTTSASDEILMPNSLLQLNGLQFSDFTFNPSGNFGIGTYRVIDASSISGGLGANTSGNIAGLAASLSLAGGDVMLTVVPEPCALISLCLGVLGLFAYVSRHRK